MKLAPTLRKRTNYGQAYITPGTLTITSPEVTITRQGNYVGQGSFPAMFAAQALDADTLLSDDTLILDGVAHKLNTYQWQQTDTPATHPDDTYIPFGVIPAGLGKWVALAAGKGSIAPALGCVHISQGCLAATDRFRLHYTQPIGDTTVEGLIPAWVIVFADKLNATLSLSETRWKVQTNTLTATGNLVTADPIKWRAVLKPCDTPVFTPGDDILDFCKKHKKVAATFNPSGLVSMMKADKPIEPAGETLFNGYVADIPLTYRTDFLADALAGGNVLTANGGDNLPLTITYQTHGALVMPIKQRN